MVNESLKNDLLNQKRTHEERISVLKTQKSSLVAELKQRQAVVKTINNQLAKLDGTVTRKHKKLKSTVVKPESANPKQETKINVPTTQPQPQKLNTNNSESQTAKNLVTL